MNIQLNFLEQIILNIFLFLRVSTTCYDDPIKDHSGPAIIKYMADKSNDTYVKNEIFLIIEKLLVKQITRTIN